MNHILWEGSKGEEGGALGKDGVCWGCRGVVEFKQAVFQVPIRKEIANHAIDI